MDLLKRPFFDDGRVKQEVTNLTRRVSVRLDNSAREYIVGVTFDEDRVDSTKDHVALTPYKASYSIVDCQELPYHFSDDAEITAFILSNEYFYSNIELTAEGRSFDVLMVSADSTELSVSDLQRGLEVLFLAQMITTPGRLRFLADDGSELVMRFDPHEGGLVYSFEFDDNPTLPGSFDVFREHYENEFEERTLFRDRRDG